MSPMTRKRRVSWYAILVVVLLVLAGLLQVAALFSEPKGRAVALGYFACGATVLVAYLGRKWLVRFGRPETHGAGWRFVLLGSLGAAWVETAFWAAEKLTGAVGVAASPNLILDLLVTMPWYLAMVTLLGVVQRRFRYHWTTVALLGGLYEVGADGLVGYLLQGNTITLPYLGLLLIYFWIFVVLYAPIVLLPVWAVPVPEDGQVRPRWQRIVAALLPLSPLIPYGLILHTLFG